MERNNIARLCAALAIGEEFSDGIGEALHELHFETPPSAWKNLGTLHGQANFETLYPAFFPDFLWILSLSFDPDKGLNNFERFSKEIYDKNYLYHLLTSQEKLLSNLISLFSGSQYLTDLLLKEPETFNWLQLPSALSQSKLKDQLYRESWELISKCKTEEAMYRAVRKFKKKEYLRIGLRDLTRLAPLQIILGEISDLADVLLQQCYEFSLADLLERHGQPYYTDAAGEERPCEFTIIGMGKLGGRELNYSSDIDILYVYTSEKGSTKPEKAPQRSISNHEFFTKLGRKITSAMNKLTADGSVFRVDLGLRPEGSSGDIVSSLRSYEIYYESWGRTWERMALLKARPCAGSMALGNEFTRIIKPFVYRKYLDFRALGEVKDMKEKINKEAVHSRAVGSKNVKLGAGGIREIEFTAQVFNLIYGGKDQRIRVNNLLDSLDRLSSHNYITEEERGILRNAYIFLRELEHRIQISFGLQTQEFSQDRKELEKLALKMGIEGRNRDELCEMLEKNFSFHTGEVRKIYNRLFYEGEMEEGQKQRPPAVPYLEKTAAWDLDEKILEPFPFREKKKILKNLLFLRDGPPFFHPSEKSVSNFNYMVPAILEKAARQADPDQAIHNLEKFVSRCNVRESLYEMLAISGEALSLLLTVFGSSDLLANTLINQPYLLDSIFDPEWLHRFKPREALAQEMSDSIAGISGPGAVSDKLRIFKRGEEFRIGLRYLLKELSYEDMMGDLSNLAELYLERVLKISLDIISPGASDPKDCGFVIIGMGKLGGREIDYGSDLDIIFIYDETKSPPGGAAGRLAGNEYFSSIGEHIYKLTSHPTKAGLAYTIDTGLRPEGKKGTLTTSLQGFGEYLKKRAAIWERQSLIKARRIAGDEGVSKKFFKTAHGFVYGDPVSLSSIAEIRRLRKRVEEEVPRKGKSGVNIKLGPGGLMDIEFIAQLFQLQYGHSSEKLRLASTLEALSQVRRMGLMDPADCDFLSGSYLFLRKTLNSMRMSLEGAADSLPDQPDQIRKLEHCLGYGKGPEDKDGPQGAGAQSPKLFIDECRGKMERIREIYNRVFTVKTGEAGER